MKDLSNPKVTAPVTTTSQILSLFYSTETRPKYTKFKAMLGDSCFKIHIFRKMNNSNMTSPKIYIQ